MGKEYYNSLSFAAEALMQPFAEKEINNLGQNLIAPCSEKPAARGALSYKWRFLPLRSVRHPCTDLHVHARDDNCDVWIMIVM